MSFKTLTTGSFKAVTPAYGAETGERYFVYLLSNESRTMVYTGVTNNLRRRVSQLKSSESFTQKINADRLVYFETFLDPYSAIAREREIKASNKSDKDLLIETVNGSWSDLYERL